MGIADDVKAALADFEKDNPKLAGKAYLTSGDRSVAEQIEIILDPKREDNYLHIKERFKSKCKLKAPPARADLQMSKSHGGRPRLRTLGRQVAGVSACRRICTRCISEKSRHRQQN